MAKLLINVCVDQKLKEEIETEANKLNLSVSGYFKFLHGFWRQTKEGKK